MLSITLSQNICDLFNFTKKETFTLDVLNKISTLLSKKNKNQRDLTDFLGLSKNTFTNWKSGNNTSYLKYISKIAEYLEVSTDYLLGNEQKESPLPFDSEQLKLFNDIKSLTPAQQQALRVLVDSYKQK